MIIDIGISEKHRTMSFCVEIDALFFSFLSCSRDEGAKREGLVHTKQKPGG